jgi:hypothetical protein
MSRAIPTRPRTREKEITQTPEETALIEAAQEGDTTTVVALLKAGTNANCRDEMEFHPVPADWNSTCRSTWCGVCGVRGAVR